MTTPYAQGFASLTRETHIDDLPVQGKLPDWLSGRLVRNGPGQWDLKEQRYNHWFDGLAMLHSFTFAQGQVAYANRFLHSNVYEKDTTSGRINYRSFATDPCRSWFSRVFSLFSGDGDVPANANVSVEKIAGQYVALTETPMAVRFDPQTLETLGVVEYDDALKGQMTTAHPHYDPERNLGINYLLEFGPTMTYHIYGWQGQTRRRIARLPAQPAAYMHSIGMTQQYVILAEFSLRLPNALAVLFSGKPLIENYRWLPDQPAVFSVIDKDSGAVVARVETEAFFGFHHINAFERGDELVLDIAAYTDARIVHQFKLDNLRIGPGDVQAGEFRRYRVPLKGGRATYEQISETTLELPRIHYRAHNTREYRYAYGVGLKDASVDFYNQLVKIDVERGTAQVWHEPGCYPSEPVFVPAPDARREDDGVILSVALDTQRGVSFLLVLDATNFSEIARADTPHGIPFGFHGQFFGEK